MSNTGGSASSTAAPKTIAFLSVSAPPAGRGSLVALALSLTPEAGEPCVYLTHVVSVRGTALSHFSFFLLF